MISSKTKTPFSFAAVILAAQLMIVGIFSWQLPPQIPLWYSLPYGRAQLADRLWFLIIPALSLAGFLVFWLLSKLGRNFLAIYLQLLAWLVALISFLGLVAMIHIVILVL